MLNKKGVNKKKFFGILATIAVIVTIFMVGPATAVQLLIKDVSVSGRTVDFSVAVDIEEDEFIPVDDLEVIIKKGGDVVDTCTFSVSGANSCADFTITQNNAVGYDDSSYAGYGYGYYSSNPVGYYNVTDAVYSGSGYGYGYTPGYGYSASPYGELSYDIKWNAPNQDATYNIEFKAKSDSFTYISEDDVSFSVSRSSSGRTYDDEEDEEDSSDENVESSQSAVFGTVKPGMGLVLLVSDDSIGVTELLVVADEDGNQVPLIVSALNNLPEGTSMPPGTVMQYLDISAGGIKVRNAEVDFKIPLSWLTDNGFNNNEVRLFHYTGSEWEELLTSYVETSGGYAYFSANTGSFSTFAIGGVKTPVEEEPTEPVEEEPTEPVEEEPTEPVEEEPTQPVDDEEQADDEETIVPTEKGSALLWVLLLVLVAGIAVGGFLYYKKQNE